MIDNLEKLEELVNVLQLQSGNDYLLVFDRAAISMEQAARVPQLLLERHGVKVSVLLVHGSNTVQMFDLRTN